MGEGGEGGTVGTEPNPDPKLKHQIRILEAKKFRIRVDPDPEH